MPKADDVRKGLQRAVASAVAVQKAVADEAQRLADERAAQAQPAQEEPT